MHGARLSKNQIVKTCVFGYCTYYLCKFYVKPKQRHEHLWNVGLIRIHQYYLVNIIMHTYHEGNYQIQDDRLLHCWS